MTAAWLVEEPSEPETTDVEVEEAQDYDYTRLGRS
jgi:hypothetical protein